jgi:hypothetical protein
MTKKKANPQKAGRKKTGNVSVSCRVDAPTWKKLSVNKPYAPTMRRIIENHFKNQDDGTI